MNLKSIAAAVCAVAIITTSYLVAPAGARVKKEHRHDEDRYAAQQGWGGKEQGCFSTTVSVSRMAPIATETRGQVLPAGEGGPQLSHAGCTVT
jgi:hypothetical protein